MLLFLKYGLQRASNNLITLSGSTQYTLDMSRCRCFILALEQPSEAQTYETIENTQDIESENLWT